MGYTNGVDGAIANTSGTVNVLCYDCHNSHGSTVTGTTTRYASATVNGGILKDTTVSRNGYAVAYKPYTGGSTATKNKRNAGASLCLDCHMNATASQTPVGVHLHVRGHPENPRLLGHRLFRAWHLRLPHPVSLQGRDRAPGGSFRGIHVDCRFPHQCHRWPLYPLPRSPRREPDARANQQYAVPLLKGTWLTSPYKEDTAPANNGPGTAINEGVPYHIDQNTLASGAVTETVNQFAGLCLTCHAKGDLTNGSNHTWKSKDRIHEAVKGWKTANGTIQHNYTCSKCHSPHNSWLPRLMLTNCLNNTHKGRVVYNPAPALSGGGSGDYSSCSSDIGACGDWDTWPGWGSGSGGGNFPGRFGGSADGIGSNPITCHEGNSSDQTWNVVTPWLAEPPIAMTSGPAAGSFSASGSYVQGTVSWSTNDYSSSYVDYGLTAGYGSTTGNGGFVQVHSILLQNLANHSTYHYRVRSCLRFRIVADQRGSDLLCFPGRPRCRSSLLKPTLQALQRVQSP